MGDNMRFHVAAVKRLRRQLKEIEQRRKAIMEAIRAQEALIRLDGGDVDEEPKQASQVVAAAEKALAMKSEPMKVSDLIAAMQAEGWEPEKTFAQVRATVVSTLRRRTDVFSTPSRGCYGLTQWDEGHGEEHEEH